MADHVATLIALVTLVALAAAAAAGAAATRGERGAVFRDGEFVNLDEGPERGFGDFLKWIGSRKPGAWDEWREQPPGPPPPAEVPKGSIRVTWVNHSTVLIQIDGWNILTDPIWSERASPVSFAGPRRHAPPGIRFEDLPRIDAVLVSHNHYDHMDLPTLSRLDARSNPRVLTGLGGDKHVRKVGIRNVGALDWWQREELGGLAITFVPAQHFSQRGVGDHNAALWGGFVVEGSGGRVFFAGDTGFGPHFAFIRERLGPMTVALLPIGAFRPEWFMGRVHMSPGDAVKAHAVLEAGTSIAIHHSTFQLAEDAQDEPVALLKAAREKAGLAPARFLAPAMGEGIDITASQGTR